MKTLLYCSLTLASVITAGIPAARAATRSRPDIFALLDAPDLERRLSLTSFAARGPLLQEISNRLEASEKTIPALEKSAKSLDGVSHGAFISALNVVKAREKDLRHSLADARKATPDTWEHAQIMLTSKYEIYAIALEVLNVESPAPMVQG